MIQKLLAWYRGWRIRVDADDLSRLELSNGNVLVVRLPDSAKYAEQVQCASNIHGLLQYMGLDDVGILIINKSDDVQRLSEKTMNRLGWYRSPNTY